jgi:hypothetical protein
MPTSTLTRRAASGALAAAILAALPASQGALARARVSRTGIHVDVGPLRANAGDPTATWVAEYLPAQLAEALVSRGAHANLSVRIDFLTLGSNSGGNGPAGSSYDNIEGVATINGVERPVRATSSYYPFPIDQTMIEESNRERVRLLTQALAYWIAQDAAR